MNSAPFGRPKRQARRGPVLLAALALIFSATVAPVRSSVAS